MPWRVFPWDPAAQPGEPFSSSYIHPSQGAGRFDIPGKLVVYFAETAVHAVAEKLASWENSISPISVTQAYS